VPRPQRRQYPPPLTYVHASLLGHCKGVATDIGPNTDQKFCLPVFGRGTLWYTLTGRGGFLGPNVSPNVSCFWNCPLLRIFCVSLFLLKTGRQRYIVVHYDWKRDFLGPNFLALGIVPSLGYCCCQSYSTFWESTPSTGPSSTAHQPKRPRNDKHPAL